MRHATLQAKPTRQSAARIQQDPAAGPNGVSLTPPTYGLDFVDRASAEAGDVRSAGAVSVHAAPSMIIQPKLMLGPVSDQYEQEADRMARQVVERVHTATSRPAGQAVHRLESDHVQRAAVGAEGGDIDVSLQSDINAARGGGQPLADPIREPMERAFGADFSGVRIHTDAQSDQLNQSIQAKAFTTGRDVFFRQGAYAPGSRGGQELIAHELTHVVQQNGIKGDAASTQSVSENHIQRAIGVELECTNLHITNAPNAAKKGDVIAGGYHWEMMYETTSAGEAVVEFKTQPPAELQIEFLRSVSGMASRAAALDRSMPTQIGNYEIQKEGNIEGAAQVTIGVPLENLPAVYAKFGELSDTLSYKKYKKLVEDQGTQSEKDPDGKYVKDLPEETKGFILLCIDYIQRGYIPKDEQKKKPKRADYTSDTEYEEDKEKFKESGRVFVKGMYDVMARTDFQTIFSTLSPTEQKRISFVSKNDSKRKIRKTWVNWLIANATRPWDHVKRTFISPYSEDSIAGKKQDKLINEKITGLEEVGAGPKRGEWLRQMPNEDQLTKEGFMGIGKLGVKTDQRKSDSAKAPIFELRAPEQNSIGYKQWMDKAGEWWTLYVSAVNNKIIKRES